MVDEDEGVDAEPVVVLVGRDLGEVGGALEVVDEGVHARGVRQGGDGLLEGQEAAVVDEEEEQVVRGRQRDIGERGHGDVWARIAVAALRLGV